MSGHISGGAECIITERDSYMARLPKRKASSCAVVEAKICCPAVVLGKWIIVLLGVKFVVLGAKKLSFWGQKLHILSFFHRVKAHEVVSACGVSADVAQHHVSWTGSIAWHWLCLRFCADFAESNKLKTCCVIRISWNWTCCKNLPGSRHYTLGWVPSLDSGKQCHSRIELIYFDPRKKNDERLEILGYLTRP